VSGLVWREGFDGDSVCVTPARRVETWQENAKAGVGSTGGAISSDAALLNAVNDARLHPGKYPPNGNTQGAVMAACPKPLGDSWALDNTAATHNKYLSSVSGDVANAFPGVHRNPPPNGVLSWAPTRPTDVPADLRQGPIQASGYDKARGEIVATGQATATQVLQFWMQNDERSQWGHRNNILNCGYTDAGAAHLAGGPLGNYWTVDLGAH
jgi:hypothetical protein